MLILDLKIEYLETENLFFEKFPNILSLAGIKVFYSMPKENIHQNFPEVLKITNIKKKFILA